MEEDLKHDLTQCRDRLATRTSELAGAEHELKVQRRAYRDMLRRVSTEIEMRNHTIDYLTPKAEAYDTLRQVLGLLPRPLMGGEPDIMHIIRNELAELGD